MDVADSRRFHVVRQYLEAIAPVLEDPAGLQRLDFVENACDFRALYWDSPKTLREKDALDAAAALFVRLRDELASSGTP